MHKAWCAGGRIVFLYVAAFLTAATVAASVRARVVSEATAIADNAVVSESAAMMVRPRNSEKLVWLTNSGELLSDLVGAALFFQPGGDTPVWNRSRAGLAMGTHAVEPRETSYGLASYYGSGSRTATGETVNEHELTAAHRTLPFGTRVRVTSLSTGESVMVRINDRGPYVRGRIVDLSHSAAEKLGLIGRGVARVKLDVVEWPSEHQQKLAANTSIE